MEVKDLKTYVVGNPIPYYGGFYWIFLKLTTDDGVEGFGEVYSVPFNPGTVEEVMCRRQVSVGWDGTLYDCDFNLALDLPVRDAPSHIDRFDLDRLRRRTIVTGNHCFGCTAGQGSSCGGALTDHE